MWGYPALSTARQGAPFPEGVTLHPGQTFPLGGEIGEMRCSSEAEGNRQLPCTFSPTWKCNRRPTSAFPTPPRRLARGDPSMGRGTLTHKSCRRRAYAQWIVTTRLLYHLHDPAELISRMQRIYPRALSNCHTSARDSDFHRDVIADPLRFRAKGLFVFSYDVRGEIVTFWHGF